MASYQAQSHFSSAEEHGSSLVRPWASHLVQRKQDTGARRYSWKPASFRLVTLLTITLLAWVLIAILQILLVRSQRDGGIILMSSIDDIPFAQSFSYKYLPTIIALVFSIFWSWIDLQVKRVEPYYQLSKIAGVWGKDSLLLSYPFDFMPFVPLSAFRNRHWAVFWAGTSMLFITWGVVPFQAGIFATETILRTTPAVFSRSLDFIPASKQKATLTNRYVHSSHGIIWLNETLPPYMTRDYVLAPFKLQEAETALAVNQTWTSDTTLYSLDMKCEVPMVQVRKDEYNRFSSEYVSSNGCSSPTDLATSFGNETIGPKPSLHGQSVYDTKEFASLYIGYYSTDTSDYYLSQGGKCLSNHTFMALYTRNKNSANDPPQNVTRLYCIPFYYQQDVTAVVDASTQRPLKIEAKSEKVPLPAETWDSKFFEDQMNGGKQEQIRDTLPLKYWPDQLETLSTVPLSLAPEGLALVTMAGLVVGASQRSLADLLDPEALRAAYETTYRIIFARSMVEILDQKFTNTRTVNGSTEHMTAAVVVVPVFTYLVEGLLGFVSLCSIALIVISIRRKWSLHSDPATIASVMALVADNPTLLGDFTKLDGANKERFEESLKDKKFQLEYNERGNIITEADSFDPLDHNSHGIVRTESDESQPAKPIRPREFQSLMVLPFVSLLIALAITLGVLLLKSQPYGIVRPSSRAIVRQLIENYIPTAIATFIEPVWVLVNRLMCMLQPFEELRGGNATPQKSINADYSSLPPQLVIIKALRSSHFKLAAVCTMALLTNVLAIAFSGMFDERSVIFPYRVPLQPPYETKFVSINGTVGPGMLEQSGAFTGGLGTNQFLVAESNYTAGTPLPAWTGNQLFFVPFADKELLKLKEDERLEARTTAVGAELDCQQIDPRNLTASWYRDSHNSGSTSDVSVTIDGVACEKKDIRTEDGPEGVNGGLNPYCEDGRTSMELVLLPQARQNASLAEQDFCARLAVFGYVRDANICRRNTTTFDQSNALFVGCRTKIVAGEATVLVGNDGRVHKVSQLDTSSDLSSTFTERHFSNNASNLLRQGNTFLLRYPGARWHNQSFASEFMNYFMFKQANNSRLIDPNLPLPSLEEVTRQLYPVYSKLFAIWLGINRDKLLVPRNNGSSFTIEGWIHERQTRIFLSMPLFIIAEAILGIYTIVAVCIYLWRPGRFLPRMPTSIGAIIALFAASQAVCDMHGTSLLTRKERKRHVEGLGTRYGYGTFVGVDGRLHQGIEKEPLVNAVPVLGIVEKVQTGFSQKSLVFKRSRN
ncbi:uncharacterized protein K460DRAFT_363966 [Cucurbitaria berberidis CBS 394.84]|uniref:Uncharacterized protein n=1 Tax=Cucurbitaria berberidis CBS 394.84 TaxID=1168544 RepID=A0A9P4GLP1_9PLEO|nr:uncharacterized protein K460DRAFT_363966 [Cucurbitaria berberidis CBS 394.84]KAF1847952.1 hypothetical protein K460DRAFT_363966 [Cucurbitaria berberidis CBS 394.84]